MGLIKSGDDLFDKGNDWIKQKEFSKAMEVFQKAIVKYQKDNDTENINLANAMASTLAIYAQPTAQNYYAASIALNTLGDQEIKFGLKTVQCPFLAYECGLVVEELNAKSIPLQNDRLKERGDKLLAVGQKYQTNIGTNSLFIPEIFYNYSVSGISRAYSLFAESQENFAEYAVWNDPKKAAEYYQTAVNYRKQIGDVSMEKKDTEKIWQYSKAVTCWICGREITGEMVHFYPMPSEITPVQRMYKTAGPLPSVHEREDMVYACRACHSAISKRADQIAEHYHKFALAEIARVERQLNARIDSLQRLIPTTVPFGRI